MSEMMVDGFKAMIRFVPDMQMFRGEFINLSGGADFYATDVQGLEREGKISLDIYLDACKRNGISPHKP
jgi:predicted HicB family RNase H-like nuclease